MSDVLADSHTTSDTATSRHFQKFYVFTFLMFSTRNNSLQLSATHYHSEVLLRMPTVPTYSHKVVLDSFDRENFWHQKHHLNVNKYFSKYFFRESRCYIVCNYAMYFVKSKIVQPYLQQGFCVIEAGETRLIVIFCC